MALTKIYLIRNGDFAKIGKSDDPVSRWRSLQSGSPFPLHLLGWFEADASEEKQLHQRFSAYHECGEWFRWCGELADFAASMSTPTGEANDVEIITPTQCRTARGGLRMSADALAERTKVHRVTINKFENGKTRLLPLYAEEIKKVLEDAGAEFPDLETVRFPRTSKLQRIDIDRGGEKD